MERKVRRKKKYLRPNPLFEKWLTEWKAEAAEKGLQTRFIYSKALQSLKKYPLPLASGKEAKILGFFGDKICNMLDERLQEYKRGQLLADKSSDSKIRLSTKSKKNISQTSSNSSTVDGSSSISTMKEPVKLHSFSEVFNHVPAVDLPKNSSLVASSVNSFSLVPGSFSVLLCVDNCETYSHTRMNRQELLTNLGKQGINFEVRKLHVGDFLWIAKEKKWSNSRRSETKELVLDFVVERKRIDDLARSIKDGRFHEQKFRMRNCGLRRPIYLVEERKSLKHIGLPEATLEQAMVNTQIVDGFVIKRTSGIKESAEYLAAMTRYIRNAYEGITLMSGSREEVQSTIRPSNMFMEFHDFNSTSIKNKRLNVNEMFAKHLLQLYGLSVDRAAVIVEKFQTPAKLFEAYQMCLSEEEKIKMLSTLKYGKSQRNLGQVLSRALYQLYCTSGSLP